ncbi:MAG: NAD(P)-dependent alcohol dehydrogenase [Thaumarchaeota archaeon]|nr:NAD(P)-dependent alcohol dehydrogenase [Nitrososphaerota archaeon]
MRAVVAHRYGPPEVLELQDVAKPILTDGRVLVRVKAASVNPVDKYSMRGPLIMRVSGGGLLRPKIVVQGADLAGVVEEVGRGVTRFKPGDEVFGTGRGSFAQYASAREDRLSLKPANLTFEEAAGFPIAAITALQALRDKGRVRPGQRVLIIGASGGVGTYAVQIAKSFGAEVTGVCSAGKMELARSLGADRVIDYSMDDFVSEGLRYDLVVDVVGTLPLSDRHRILASGGTLVLVGADTKRGFARVLLRMAKAKVLSALFGQKIFFLAAKIDGEDLEALKVLAEAGKVNTVVDRSFPLGNASDAMRYLEEGHARGKVVIEVSGQA